MLEMQPEWILNAAESRTLYLIQVKLAQVTTWNEWLDGKARTGKGPTPAQLQVETD